MLASRTGAFSIFVKVEVVVEVVGVGIVKEDVVDEVVVEVVEAVVAVGTGVGIAGVGTGTGVGARVTVVVVDPPSCSSPLDLLVELEVVVKEEGCGSGCLEGFPSFDVFVFVVEVELVDLLEVVLEVVDDVVFFPLWEFRRSENVVLVVVVVEVLLQVVG